MWLGAQRQFNTAHLLAHYMGDKALSGDAIAWNRNDPNTLSIRLPGESLLHVYCSLNMAPCSDVLLVQAVRHKTIHTLHERPGLTLACVSAYVYGIWTCR